MAHFASPDFVDDELDADPITFDLRWRASDDQTKVGKETFECFPDVPFGVLLDVEGGAPSAGYKLLYAALRDDDGKQAKGEPVVGTSSLERYEALTHDRGKKIPASAISEVLRFLLVEYSSRRNPQAAAVRPTQLPAPSSGRRSSTGRGSTAKPRAKASTSGRSTRRTA